MNSDIGGVRRLNQTFSGIGKVTLAQVAAITPVTLINYASVLVEGRSGTIFPESLIPIADSKKFSMLCIAALKRSVSEMT